MTWADILQEAQDLTHQPTTATSGMWSNDWWNRRINRAKDILYQITGCYQTTHNIDVTANVSTYSLPSTLCWGISSVRFDNNNLTPYDIYTLDEDNAGWERNDGNTPTRFLIKHPYIILNTPPDRSVTTGTDIAGTSSVGITGLAMTTQPDNDGIEIRSDNVADSTQTATIYYVTSGSNSVQTEAIALSGTTWLSSSATDMDNILGVALDAVCAGTITIRDASGDVTITTITTGNTTKGIYDVPTGTQDAGKVHPTCKAVDNSPACTAQIGLIGTDESGNDVTDCCVNITGTTARKFPVAMDTVTQLLLGAVPTTNSVLVEMGCALELWGGALETDITGTTSSNTASPTGVPAQFAYLIAQGAAKLALMINNYEQPEVLRATAIDQIFGPGLQELIDYLNTLQFDRQQAIRVESRWD